jgi:hypothetical protein
MPHTLPFVGRTPWSAADALVGPVVFCERLIPLYPRRDEGVPWPRGHPPGGPPHPMRGC